MERNLLLLIADQLRWDCLGYARQYPVSTPHIDELAQKGTIYTNAFAATPICAPMRQALITGRYPNRTGAVTNHDIMPTIPLQPESTWTYILKNAGWNGALVGNLHAPYNCDIHDFGFERYYPRESYFQDISIRYPNLKYRNGFWGEKSPLPLSDSMTHWTSKCICDSLRAFSESGKPWFIWAEYLAPHLPCRPSEPFASQYAAENIPPWGGFDDSFHHKPYMQKQQVLNWHMEGKSWNDISETAAMYYATISQLDDAIGKVLECLKETAQDRNTIVVIVSDHGDMCGSHHMMDKGYIMYDDVVHVPMTVFIPDQQPMICTDFVSSFLDLSRSIASWCGIEEVLPMDGIPLPDNAAGADNPRKWITSAYNGQQFGLYCQRMLRNERWKYVWNACDIDELYDLSQDPYELNNLIDSAECTHLLSEMRAVLYHEMKQQGDWLFSGDWLSGQFLNGRKAIRE